jgi:hypothetical protein
MVFEIHANKLGKPYLKKVDRPRKVSEDGRGLWVDIGNIGHTGIDRVVRTNQKNGLLVLMDDTGTYRALVLTD